MTQSARRSVQLAMAGVLALAVAHGVAAQAVAVSGAKAKELAALMKSKQIQSFAMRESVISDRFMAVMLVPDVQILVVSAVYGRPTDIDYHLYHKDYQSAYRTLAGGALSKERFFVADVLGDGLVANPAKNAPPDSVTIDATQQSFVGPADPKKRNDTRMPADAYAKMFSSADERYGKILDGLIAELKKPGVLETAGSLR